MSNFCRLSQNTRWRPKGNYEGIIYISIYRVKATVLSLLSYIFVLRLDMFQLFPLSEP